MSISKEIAYCDRCKNNIPFFFEIQKQKIMIITGSSTIQSSYAPLITVRFLRNLLYGLFGYEGVSEVGFLRFFNEDGIYWTSYNKCYDSHFLRLKDDKYAMDRFKNKTCGRYFLQKEIDSLKPRWILVIGDGVVNEVKSLQEGGNLKVSCEISYMDSFHLEDPKIVQSIREKTAEILNIDLPKDSYDRNDTHTTNNNLEVNLSFQTGSILTSAMKLGTTIRNSSNFENKVEELWTTGFVNDLKSRYYTFIDVWNSIETSLRTFLLKECDPTDNNSMNESLENLVPLGGEDYIDSYLKMKDDLFRIVNKYYSAAKYKSLEKRWKNLNNKLYYLFKIRNAIVHNFGFVPYKLLYKSNEENKYYDINNKLKNFGIKGIKLLTNMVYISPDGVEEIIKVFEEVKILLLDTEKKKNIHH